MNEKISLTYRSTEMAVSGAALLVRAQVPFTFTAGDTLPKITFQGEHKERVTEYLEHVRHDPQVVVFFATEEAPPRFANLIELKNWLGLDFDEGPVATIKAYRARTGCGLREAHDFVTAIPH